MAINLFFNPIRKKEKKFRGDFRFSVTVHPFRVSWNFSDAHLCQYTPAAFKFHAFCKKKWRVFQTGPIFNKRLVRPRFWGKYLFSGMYVCVFESITLNLGTLLTFFRRLTYG
jgi:hypothetical protein